MSIAEKLTQVAQNQQKIATQYFRTSFIGDGTKKASFAIPFMPDMLDIFGVAPYIETSVNNFSFLGINMKSASHYGGKYGYCNQQGNIGSGNLKTSSVLSAISYEDGVFTWDLPAMPPSWSPNVRYYVTAVKFPDHDTRDMVEEEISLLPDVVPSNNSGVLRYNATQINSAFTSDEWAALIAQKPNWTFSMV